MKSAFAVLFCLISGVASAESGLKSAEVYNCSDAGSAITATFAISHGEWEIPGGFEFIRYSANISIKGIVGTPLTLLCSAQSRHEFAEHCSSVVGQVRYDIFIKNPDQDSRSVGIMGDDGTLLNLKDCTLAK